MKKFLWFFAGWFSMVDPGPPPLVAEQPDASTGDVKRVHVVVALCDNQYQRIAPVNARIGNGDDLENNLYWGCSDGLWRYFEKASDWELVESKKATPVTGSEDPWKGISILETQRWRHRSGQVELIAEAWRGKEIEGATRHFVELLADNTKDAPDLVAWIGHNGLMDFPFSYHPKLETEAEKKRDGIVLCCRSRAYFSEILQDHRVRPLLMTDQLMYPGSFILKAAIDGWIKGESPGEIRERAAKSYAQNQGISVRAARGVFSKEE